MAKKFLVSLDLNKNELLNARIQNLASAPSSPVTGQAYYDTALGKFGTYNGSTWDYMGTSAATGDVSSNTASSVDSEIALFSGTAGKTIKRATGTGLAKLTAGVLSTATSGTDYTLGTAALGTGILKNTTGTGDHTIAVAGDFPTLNQSTTGSAATLTTPRAIYGNNFDGSAALNQIIASTYGGTGNGFTKFSGATTSEKTYTLPNASATILTDNAAVTVAQGGTGRATGTTAYALIATGTTATGAQQTLAAGATTEILVGGGASALPVWTTAQGSGAPVRATSPTLTTPNLGTPSAVVLTSGTGLPISTGLTGAGTGVLTALAVNVGSAGAFVTYNGAGGTPSAITLTNGTGLPESGVTNLVSDLALKAPLANPTFTGTVTVPTPSAGTDAANKTYVDNAVQGLSWKQAVRVASTANITVASALTNGSTIDGVTVATGDRVLLKDQSTASQNGIYTVVASGAASRTADADSSAEIDSMTVYVEQGTANGDTVWTLTTNDPTIGSTSLAYAQVNGGALPSASTTVEGKVELATQAEAQAKTDTTRALTAASVADFARKYTGTIGNGSLTDLPVTHGLGSQYVTAQVFDATSNALVECDIVLTSSTVTTFTFAVAPTTNQFRVVITG